MKTCNSEKTTLDYYRSNALNFFNDTVSIDLNEIYRPFIELLPDKGVILDAGCGSGRDTKFFMNKGFRVTAFDNSCEMVKLASEFTGQACLLLSFDEIDFINIFDGVWACSSVLHVHKSKILKVLKKFACALKPGGILYASFKYGNEEIVSHGRHFSNYDENSFSVLLKKIKEMKLIRYWKTNDTRPDRGNKWLNILLKKQSGFKHGGS